MTGSRAAALSPLNRHRCALVAARLNDDEYLDLAVTNYYSSTVSILLGTGGGSFAPGVSHFVGVYPTSLAAGDFDRDGDVDLAVALEWDGEVAMLRNQGGGSYAVDPVRVAAGLNPFSVVATQINDDNYDGRIDDRDALDLAVANFGEDGLAGGVSVAPNNGSGSFPFTMSLPAGEGPAGIAAGDLDGDGDADLAVANFRSDDVSILLNVGNGSYVRLPDGLPAGKGPYAVTAADVDLDGKPDLLVANADEGHLVLLRNRSQPGSIAFAPAQTLGAGTIPGAVSSSVTTADFNKDGVPDVAVANGIGGSVSVLLNSVYAGAYEITLDGVNPAPPLDFGNVPVLPAGRDELIVGFGAAGLWVWENKTSWNKLHGVGPEDAVTGDLSGNGQDELIVDFGQPGLWIWEHNTSWHKLHGRSPELMVTGDLDGNGQDELIVDFGDQGVWTWWNNTSWDKLHTGSPDVLATGDLDGPAPGPLTSTAGPSAPSEVTSRPDQGTLHDAAFDSLVLDPDCLTRTASRPKGPSDIAWFQQSDVSATGRRSLKDSDGARTAVEKLLRTL